MKIDGIAKGLSITPNSSPSKNGATNGLDFNSLLAEQLHNSTAGVSNSTAATGTTQSSEANTNYRMAGLEVTESTLNTLSSYGEALANTNLSALELEPFISALEQDTLALLAIRNQLPADNSLGKILDNLATISYVETTKYRRGDYDA